MAQALVSDAVDHQESIAGRRDEGLLYAGYSFASKTGTALGSASFAWALALGGYQSVITTGTAAGMIQCAFLGLPIVLSFLQILAMRLYRLEHTG